MPVALTYPGVYVEEVASDVRTIVGVPTSITAFIGRALRGPTDVPLRIQSFAEFERAYGGLWSESTLGYAVQQFFLNGGADAVIARVHNQATTSSLTLQGLSLDAANEGDWGDQLRVRVDHATSAPAADLFNLYVRDTATDVTERHLNVSTNATHSRFVTRVLESSSNLVRVSNVTGRPDAHPDLTAGANLFDAGFSTAFPASGSDGDPIGEAEIIGGGLEAARLGIWLLEHAESFNLLCIPPFERETDVTKAVWDQAAAYCARRRAVLIVDAPRQWTEPRDAIGNLDTVVARSDSAAIYFPWLLFADARRDFRPESFAPCGAVAGVIARTDAQRGVWKAPAGLDASLLGASALAFSGDPGLLTDARIGQLNPFGVNCLRTIPGTGQVVWGARTLRGADNLASQWKYLPVRRLAYYIEESLFQGTQWVVFEPNDEPLWAQIRLNVGAFMQSLFRQGAFQGTSPREAYFVKCSRETTTQADVDAGVVNILVGFAPLKPAEFVVLRIQQITQQS